MHQRSTSQILVAVMPVLSFIASVIGIITYYAGVPVATYVCAAISLFDSFTQVKWGGQNNFATEIITIVIGLVVAWIASISILPCIAVALCFGDAILTGIGLIQKLLIMRRLFKNRF